MLFVFDIDQTIIDSTIRENDCWEADILDLEKYQATKKQGILHDTLLPLGHWLEANAKLLDFVLVTSRGLTCDDWQSFFALMPNVSENANRIVSRNNAEKFGSSAFIQCSGLYKKPIFKTLQSLYNTQLVVFDDDLRVINMAKNEGFNTICARELWHYSHHDFDKLFGGLL